MKKTLFSLCTVLYCFLLFVSCDKDDTDGIAPSIIGKWRLEKIAFAGHEDEPEKPSETWTHEYLPDGTIQTVSTDIQEVHSRYTIDGEIVYMESIYSGDITEYKYELTHSRLSLKLIKSPYFCLTGVPTKFIYKRVR